jgi:hypothetical protein
MIFALSMFCKSIELAQPFCNVCFLPFVVFVMSKNSISLSFQGRIEFLFPLLYRYDFNTVMVLSCNTNNLPLITFLSKHTNHCYFSTKMTGRNCRITINFVDPKELDEDDSSYFYEPEFLEDMRLSILLTTSN